MAMTMSGEATLPASKEVVWAKLNDADVLKACIPGCDQLTKDDDTHMSAVVKVKLGPVKATFKGKVELTDLDPPNGYRIQGEGEGGIAGFAKGGADVTLTADGGDATVLKYAAKADVGGKIAQLGSRLIMSTSKKLAGEFFSTFGKKVGDAG